MVRIMKAPEERRSELITTARKLFSTKGYEQTTVSDIVKAIGVAQGTFYYYFESKKDVLDAIIEELINEQQAILRTIVEDDSLSAIPKWTKAIRATNNWKIDHKDEMIELIRLPIMQEGILREKYRASSRQKISLVFAEIICQGIEEGVFVTEYPQETAEIVIAIGKSIRGFLTDILFNPDKYDNSVDLARRKFNAVQEAMERVLGASPGSLQLIDEAMLENWFGK